MNSIPPIIKAGEFVHVTNTCRSHLDPHHPSPVPFWMLWMRWRRQREDIKPPSGRFRWSHPSSSRVLQKACQNNVPWSANTLPLRLKRYKSLLHGVEKGFVCLKCWRLGDGFIFNGCVGRYKKGCSALLVPAVWDDTYLSHQVELNQAQHTNGNVRSRSTRWCYRSLLESKPKIEVEAALPPILPRLRGFPL